MTKTDIIANLPAFCLLSIHEKFMSGDPITEAERATADRIALAAAFGAEAFIHHSGCEGGATNAMLIAFLTALTDPTSPDLDYLRRDPDAAKAARAKAARAKASQEIRGASGGSGIVVTKKATPNPEGPHRIWLDLRSFNGAVGFAHTEGHPKDGWAGYIRAYPAASSEYVISGDGTGTDLPAISEQEISADRSAPAEVKGLVDEPEPDETRTLAVTAVWKPCVHGGGWWIAKNADGCDVLLSSDTPQVANALTAQQAEIDRLRKERDALDRKWTTAVQLAAHAHNTEGDPGVLIDAANARAEAAEAGSKAWRVHAQDLMSHLGQFIQYVDAGPALRTTHAKLKGDV